MKKICSLFLTGIMFLSMCIPTIGSAEDLPLFYSVRDPDLLEYVEETTYAALVSSLHNEGYLVEDIHAVYISQEYIDELAYNSLENVFFGYTIDEVVEQFDGTRFVFTLGEDNTTIVKAFEPYDDSIDYRQIIKNVAVGNGVILLTVTVSVVGAVAGSPAICMIFAYAADGAAACAKSGAFFGAIAAGITTYSEHGDFDAAIRSAMVGGSEGYKWGAISGAVTGAAKESIWLSRATRNGLSMSEAAMIQAANPEMPVQVIRSLHSLDEYEIYQEAGLAIEKLGANGYGMTRSIDWYFVDEYSRTNIERVSVYSLAPVDETGIPYELHHIGQEPNAPLAILTKAEHMSGGNNKTLHWRLESEVEHGTEWTAQKHDFWMSVLETDIGGL